MHKLAFMPVLNPSGVFVVIINGPFFPLQQGIIHQTFGRCDLCHAYTNRINADVEVFAGICTVKVEEDVLSLPKSRTQIAPLAPAL